MALSLMPPPQVGRAQASVLRKGVGPPFLTGHCRPLPLPWVSSAEVCRLPSAGYWLSPGAQSCCVTSVNTLSCRTQPLALPPPGLPGPGAGLRAVPIPCPSGTLWGPGPRNLLPSPARTPPAAKQGSSCYLLTALGSLRGQAWGSALASLGRNVGRGERQGPSCLPPDCCSQLWAADAQPT